MTAALVLLPAAAGVSAASAWLAVRTGPVSPSTATAIVPPAVRSTAVPTDEIVPGQELAAPASGVTGTVALASAPAYDAKSAAGMRPSIAPPFDMSGASSLDRARAVECLTAAIHYEAASEPDAGQRAVAQVVLNRVRHPAFPATVCGVVYQGSERRGCQFSFACDGAMARVPGRRAWTRAARNAAAALAGGVYAPVGLATHYHTFAVTPAWNRTLVMTDVVGAHFFHRWKGWWGTAAAFRQTYRGGEPVPGPHIAASPPERIVASVAAPPPVPSIGEPATRAENAVASPPVDSSEDRLPPESQILDRWKDSGKPLR